MGGKFELDYTDVDGRRYRLDTGTDDPKIARVWLQKVQKQLSLAKLHEIPKVGQLTREMVAGKAMPEQQKRLHLADFEKEYLERCKSDLDLAQGTRSLNRYAFASFRQAVGDPFIDKITEEDVRRWKRSLLSAQKAKNSIAIYQRALKTAFKRAVKWKLTSENPFAEVEMPPTRSGEKPKKSMDISQVQTLLPVIDDIPFKRYVQFVLYTGCRRIEILNLRREDLDLAQRILYVEVPKTHRRLALPINKALMKVIEEMRQNGELPDSGYLFCRENQKIPWHPSSVTHTFKKYVRRAGLPDRYSLHSCRHTYTTYLRSKGVPQDVIQRLLGHTSTSTTDIYDHSDALFFRQFADMVDYEASEPETGIEGR
jgi:integrase